MLPNDAASSLGQISPLLFINTNGAPPDLQLNFGLFQLLERCGQARRALCAASWDDILDNARFGSPP
jgi:hypothetical protein